MHVEAGWTARGTLGPVGETQWLDQLESPPLGIVGHAVVDDPSALEAQLDAHSIASGRLRGIRDILAAHDDKRVHTWTNPARIRSDEMRAGLVTLGQRGLTFEAWCYHNQLHDLASLADDVPMTAFMLDHMGTPVGLAGPHGGQGEPRPNGIVFSTNGTPDRCGRGEPERALQTLRSPHADRRVRLPSTRPAAVGG